MTRELLRSTSQHQIPIPQVLCQKLEAYLRRAVEDKGDACIGKRSDWMISKAIVTVRFQIQSENEIPSLFEYPVVFYTAPSTAVLSLRTPAPTQPWQFSILESIYFGFQFDFCLKSSPPVLEKASLLQTYKNNFPKLLYVFFCFQQISTETTVSISTVKSNIL